MIEVDLFESSPATTMKVSFSVASKSKSNPNPIQPHDNFDASSNKDGKAKEYVKEFDASETPTDSSKSANIVIPPIQNDWRPTKRMKNLNLPITDSDVSELSFELDASSAASEPGSNVCYGLNLRQTNKNEDDAEVSDDAALERRRPEPVETVLRQKLKDDLNRLRDHQGLEEFEEVPVEGFGAALLAGYGWYEGRGIGKNATEDVKVVQYEKRTAKEGLGFVNDHSRVRNSKEIERPKEQGRDAYSIGKIVRIVGGRSAGLKGTIVQKSEDDRIIIKPIKGEEEVKVHIDEIAELGSIEEEKCLKKLKELKIQRDDRDSSRKRRRDEGRRDREVEAKQKDISRVDRKEDQKKKRVSWLTSQIRVRIVSKDFKGGRLYLKKGKVLDVVGPTTCDIYMDDNKEIIQGVSQDFLETAIPRRGGPVLVLYGKHRGVYGNLVERHLDQEIGVVRDADTQELLNVRLEQIAEYIGDPSLLGY